MKRAIVSVSALLLLFIASAALGDDFPLNSTSTTPGAAGKVSVNHDKNGNIRVDVNVKHLADPSALSPAKSGYVVWLQPSGKDAQNMGVLKVNGKEEGELKATTTVTKFDIFVTAEDNVRTDHPTGPEVLRGIVDKH